MKNKVTKTLVVNKEIEKIEIICKHPDCNKKFTDYRTLKKHMQVHAEKRFVCPVEGCGKRFLDNSKYKRHQLVHTVFFLVYLIGRETIQV